MDKVKNLTKEEILKELNRVSKNKITTEKQQMKLKEKKKPDYKIFEKPKKPKVEDYFSIETLTELRDWIHDTEARHSLHHWIKKYNKNDVMSSSSSSDEE